MGSCFSTTKVSGSNSNRKDTAKPQPAAATTVKRRTGPQSNSNNPQKAQESGNKKQVQSSGNNNKTKRQGGGVIPCGKRTDFGYDKDFDGRYTIGKLLGHGQFGYTYVATDKSSGDRVAVKRIEKNKVANF